MTDAVGPTFQPARVAIVLDVPIDDVTMDEAVERIAEMVGVGRATGRTHQVATVNVDFVVNAADDPVLMEIMRRTDLAVPDGQPIVWGARLLRTPIRERTAGADLVPALAELCARAGFRLCLFGGSGDVAALAGAALERSHPGTTILALEAPMVAADGSMEAEALDEMLAFRPDIVCVALGNPKQERWIDRHRSIVGAPVFVGVGGTLDFLAGTTTRSPAWMGRAGLEWLHRAIKEPRRLAWRYARDFLVFVPGLARQAVTGRGRDLPAIDAGDPDGPVVVDIGAVTSWGNRAAAAVCGAARAARRQDRRVVIAGGTDAEVRREAARWLGDGAIAQHGRS